jgi:uncharacterized membrane protein SirB2
MTLVFKRYFMKEVEREKYEKQLLEVFPKLEDSLFELDDYEIRDMVDKITTGRKL